MKKLTFILAILLPLLGYSQSSTYYAAWQYEGDKRITEYEIPETVKRIGGRAFHNCDNLKKIIIQDNVIQIDRYAFDDCPNLQEIFIGDNVSKINKAAFRGCPSLSSITVSPYNMYFVEENGVLYNYDKTRLIYCTSSGIKNGTIAIPKTVTEIDEYAFYKREELASITIPSNVKQINSHAFAYCTNLSSIIIENGVESIDNHVFDHCVKISTIDIPASIKEVGGFAYCDNLTSVVLHEGVEKIDRYAFSYCPNLTSLTIPASVKEIDHYAFSGCNLKNLSIATDNTEYILWNRALFNADTTELLMQFINPSGEYTIPKSVKKIGSEAFRELPNLSSIYIPGTVREIDEDAFRDCRSLKNVVLEDGIEIIGDHAFSFCYSLKLIQIPNSVKKIGEDAFVFCDNLKSVTFGNEKKIIDYEAFRRIKSITIPSRDKAIESSSFEHGYNITDVIFEDDIEEIGYEAFAVSNRLTSISLPKGFEYLRFSFFENLEYVTLSRADTIGNEAFSGCKSLASIVIPEDTKVIGDKAFYGCENLTSIIIPESVTVIGNEAFRGCKSLTSIVIPEGIKIIGDKAFRGCENLTSIIIPESVTVIGNEAFSGCTNLKSVLIGNNVVIIRDRAFCNCVNLDSITIPGGVKEIDYGAFEKCSSLSSVIINYGVEKIGAYAFCECLNLDSVIIPNSVKEIGRGLFQNCKRMTTVTIPKGLKKLDETFRDCVSLKSLTIEDGVETIEGTFYNCKSIISLSIPESVKDINEWAFYGCDNLISVTIPDSATITYRILSEYNCKNLSVVLFNNLKYIKEFKKRKDFDLIVIPEDFEKKYDLAFINFKKIKDMNLPEDADDVLRYICSRCKNAESVAELDTSNSRYSLDNGVLFNADKTELISILKLDKDRKDSCRVPDGVKIIKSGALYDVNVHEIILPNSVSIVEENALTDSDWNWSYVDVQCNSETPPIIYVKPFPGNLCDEDRPRTCRRSLFVPIQYRDQYIKSNWNNIYRLFSRKCVVRAEDIDSHDFSSCTGVIVPNATNQNIAAIVKKVDNDFNRSPYLCTLTFEANENLTEIPDSCFYNTRRVHLSSIPASVKKIGKSAFKNSFVFGDFIIPPTVSEIGDEAFFECFIDESIHLHGDKYIFGESVFGMQPPFYVKYDDNVPNRLTYPIKLSFDKLQDYINSKPNKDIYSIIVTDVSDLNIDSLAHIIADSRIYINLTLKGNVTQIPEEAFMYSKRLIAVHLPKSVTTIGDKAFRYCLSLQSISLPNRLKWIGDNAFESCISLRSIIIPNGVTHIGQYAFEDCNLLGCFDNAPLMLPKSLKQISRGMFMRCYFLESINIPKSVTKIDDFAFQNSGLNSLIVPKNVDSIGNYALSICKSLRNVSINNKKAVLGEQVFWKNGHYAFEFIAPQKYHTQLYKQLAAAALEDAYNADAYNHEKEYYSTAIKHFQKYYELDSSNKGEIFFNIGRANMGLKEYYTAIGYLKKAETVFNNQLLEFNEQWFHNYIIYRNIIQCCNEIDKLDDMQLYLQKYNALLNHMPNAYQKDSTSIQQFALEYTCWFHYKCGDFVKAKQYRDRLADATSIDIVWNGNDEEYYYYINRYDQIGDYGYIGQLLEENYKLPKHDSLKYIKLLGDICFSHNCFDTLTKQYNYKYKTYNAFDCYSQVFAIEMKKLKDNFSFMNTPQRQIYWDKHHVAFDNMSKIVSKIPYSKDARKMAYNSLLVSKGLLLASEQNMASIILNTNDENIINDYFKLKRYRNEIDTTQNIAVRDSLRNIADRLETDIINRSSQYANLVDYLNVDWEEVRNSLR